MSMATLERAILQSARVLLKNSTLRKKDILEWTTGNIEAKDGEVTFWLPNPGVNVAVKKEHDKR